MSQSPQYCFSCVDPLLNMPSYYCCNQIQLTCAKCSTDRCPKCKKQKTNLFQPSTKVAKKLVVPSKKIQMNQCDSCNESIACIKCFEEKTCKKYYCHSCIWYCYNNFTKMMQDYQRQNEETIQMGVELQCGCEIQKSQIIAYLRKYCNDCSEEITGQSIVLTNQCIIMVECIKRREHQLIQHKYDIEKRRLAEQGLQKLNSLIAVCTVCKMKIDGSQRTEWKMVFNMCICSVCLQSSKEKKEKLSVPSDKKEKEVANSNHLKLVRQEAHYLKDLNFGVKKFQLKKPIQIPLKIEKCEQKVIQRRQQQKEKYNLQKPIQIPLKIEKCEQKVQQRLQQQKEQYNQKMCKLCFSFESVMINRVCRHVIMCKHCFIKYQRKKEGKSSLPCPLCQTFGQYIQYITPIFS